MTRFLTRIEPLPAVAQRKIQGTPSRVSFGSQARSYKGLQNHNIGFGLPRVLPSPFDAGDSGGVRYATDCRFAEATTSHSDEAHFWLNGYVNKQNCRIWSEANPQVYVETPLHP
ncbi:hypothetical protein TNCV_4324581 [Trichonephila clavipes]|nr:hypothetical protein TNCV_4324581 [Trichonephila clavipes]